MIAFSTETDWYESFVLSNSTTRSRLTKPSFVEQERRLRDRGTETEDKILKRLKQTEKELQRLDLYDYIVYNSTGESDKAVADIRAIVRAERCSRRRNTDAEIKYFAKN